MPPSRTAPRPVVGRLAPSPSGRLHLGNLSTSLLAWCQARAASGRLILRIEDVDGPRVVPGAIEAIIEDLRWLGIEWDEGPDVGGRHAPYVQSQRADLYRQALEELDTRGLLYACTCSRRDIGEALSAPHGGFEPGTQYPGTCAHAGGSALRDGVAVRVRASGTETVVDEVTGTLTQDLAIVPGDFVVRRRDGLIAYQLAVVVDDGLMGVTDVVRGADLLDSAPRQAWLHRQLGTTAPRTWHVPMLVEESGERLSKRSSSVARPGLESVGWSAAEIRGAFAWMWGWRGFPEPLEIEELLPHFVAPALNRAVIPVPRAFFDGPKALRDALKP